MGAAIRVEALKLSRSLTGLVSSVAIILGVLALLAGITAGVAAGRADLIAKAGPAAVLDWRGLLAGAAQITAVAEVLGYAVVLAWMFGREFAEGTITGLFALPVTRGHVAVAKLTVYAAWASAVSVAMTVGVTALGLLFGYGPPAGDTWLGLGRLTALGVLSAAVALPVAYIATISRSLLAAVGCGFAIVVTAQVGAFAGAGGWMPFAAPALWAMSQGSAVSLVQLAVSMAVALLFAVLVAWARLQLDH